MIERTITVIITDDRSEQEQTFRIKTKSLGNEYELAAIIEDIAERIMNEGRYQVRPRMDDLPDSSHPY
jgi:hypothetical protein